MSQSALPDIYADRDPEFMPAEANRPAPEVEVVHSEKISCSGNEALGLGHPRVWLAIIPEIGFVDCGYCDKRYILDTNAPADPH